MRQFTPIELDKTRNLRYGFVAISKIEDTLNKSMAEIDMNKIRIKELGVIIWAGLEHEDQSLTPEIVLELIDANDVSIDVISNAVGKAISAAFGSSPKKK